MATYGKANCIYLPCVTLIFCWNRCSWLTWYCRYVTKPNNTRLNGTTNCFTLWMKKTNNFLPHWQSRLFFLGFECYLLSIIFIFRYIEFQNSSNQFEGRFLIIVDNWTRNNLRETGNKSGAWGTVGRQRICEPFHLCAPMVL